MEALKEIIEAIDTDIKIHIPNSFVGKKIEVIILPFEEIDIKEKKKEFMSLSGSWADLDTEKMKQEIYNSRKDIRRTEFHL